MEPMLAQIVLFGGNFAPRGWALCNGQLLAISQNQALFSLLGTTYGGDGRTTFGLPDLRGRAAMHSGHGPGLTNRVLGSRFGTETNTMTVNQMPSHNHSATFGVGAAAAVSIPAYTDAGESSDPTNHILAQPDITGDNFLYSSEIQDTNLRSFTAPLSGTIDVYNTGGQQPFNNMQPVLTLNYIIALVGVFPSRN